MSMRYQAGIVLPGYNALKVANAPTIGTATAGNTQVSVAFTAPSCVGGGAISSYTAYCTTTGTKTATGASSPLVVTGLTNCTAYTFKVVATNAYGPSYPSAASNSVTPANTMQYLIVAGGGSGGYYYSGGGGAGGLLTGTVSINTGTTYTITIGAGGTNPSLNAIGSSGSNSSISGSGFSTLTAIGGGGGAGSGGSGGGNSGLSGGSGGGGGGENGTGSGGLGTSGQGYAGGAAGAPGAGGGGGAGAVGGNSPNHDGGIGVVNPITNSTAGELLGDGFYWLAGGGGGNAGQGGKGGSSPYSPSGRTSSNAAVANTGGGGAGGGGTAGGSGVVVVSLNSAASATTGSPSLITAGGKYIYQFNSSGSITP